MRTSSAAKQLRYYSDVPATKRALASVPQRAQVPEARPCVLVAEHDSAMRSLLCQALKRDGHDVVEARDGYEMLEILASRLIRRKPQIDLIVSEHALPHVSGMSILAGLRDADWWTPFILMTAFGEPIVLDRTLWARATFVDKPFDLGDFRMTVLDVTFPCGGHGLDGPCCGSCGGIHHLHRRESTLSSLVCLECASKEPDFVAIDVDACSACGSWHHVREDNGSLNRHACIECLGGAGDIAKLYLDIGGSG